MKKIIASITIILLMSLVLAGSLNANTKNYDKTTCLKNCRIEKNQQYKTLIKESGEKSQQYTAEYKICLVNDKISNCRKEYKIRECRNEVKEFKKSEKEKIQEQFMNCKENCVQEKTCVSMFSHCSCSNICIEFIPGQPINDCAMFCSEEEINQYIPNCGYSKDGICEDLNEKLCWNNNDCGKSEFCEFDGWFSRNR